MDLSSNGCTRATRHEGDTTIDSDTRPAFDEKDLKVRIPVRLHIKLHSVKVLTGKNISDSITEALDAYFEASPPILMEELR